MTHSLHTVDLTAQEASSPQFHRVCICSFRLSSLWLRRLDVQTDCEQSRALCALVVPSTAFVQYGSKPATEYIVSQLNGRPQYPFAHIATVRRTPSLCGPVDRYTVRKLSSSWRHSDIAGATRKRAQLALVRRTHDRPPSGPTQQVQIPMIMVAQNYGVLILVMACKHAVLTGCAQFAVGHLP